MREVYVGTQWVNGLLHQPPMSDTVEDNSFKVHCGALKSCSYNLKSGSFPKTRLERH